MRVRIKVMHRREVYRVVEVLVTRESLVGSLVELSEEYLASELSKSERIQKNALAAAAAFEGGPMALTKDIGGKGVVILPAGGFAAGCIEANGEEETVHFGAGCKDSQGRLRCWSVAYNKRNGEMIGSPSSSSI